MPRPWPLLTRPPQLPKMDRRGGDGSILVAERGGMVLLWCEKKKGLRFAVSRMPSPLLPKACAGALFFFFPPGFHSRGAVSHPTPCLAIPSIPPPKPKKKRRKKTKRAERCGGRFSPAATRLRSLPSSSSPAAPAAGRTAGHSSGPAAGCRRERERG